MNYSFFILLVVIFTIAPIPIGIEIGLLKVKSTAGTSQLEVARICPDVVETPETVTYGLPFKTIKTMTPSPFCYPDVYTKEYYVAGVLGNTMAGAGLVYVSQKVLKRTKWRKNNG